MPTRTARDLITRALKKAGVLGVGQSGTADDFQDGLDDLNDMLSQWQRQRWLVFHLIDVSVATTGAQSYSVGPGGDFDTPRPDRLESAFFRQTTTAPANAIDYPLEVIQSREDYSRIAMKRLGTWPEAIFYDSAYPEGRVYPWPLPSAGLFELHLTLKQTLGEFADLSEEVNLPPEYNTAIWSNLAVLFQQSYQLPPTPDVPGSITRIAKKSLAVIRGANAQVATLQMPRGLRANGRYNVYSDQET